MTAPSPGTGQTPISVGYLASETDRIASLAREMRDKLKLASDAAAPIFQILEFRIIEAFPDFRFVVDYPDNFDHPVLALTRWNPPQIVVRESVYLHAAADSGPARVVLAHELGHLWLEHGRNHSLLYEWQADEFAAELLMPGDIAVSLSAEHIAKQYAVPMRTAEIRLQTLKARRSKRSANKVPKFEPYAGLLSRYEIEVLKWVPAAA